MSARWGRVVIRGGGDLGSGTALRLWRCGFEVVILETPQPVAVRRSVCFSEAIYDGEARVEEALAIRTASVADALSLLSRTSIPVLIDPGARCVENVQCDAVVDAIMAKRNTGTRLDLAQTVVAMGPGFTAQRDCHAVVETNRGPNLGRVIWNGAAEPNTGMPGVVSGAAHQRVVRAPVDGIVRTLKSIGERIENGDPLASVGGVTVSAGMSGIVRGLIRDGLYVHAGLKIGDIDPRPDPDVCRYVSDKSLAIAGGVIEALLMNRIRHE